MINKMSREETKHFFIMYDVGLVQDGDRYDAVRIEDRWKIFLKNNQKSVGQLYKEEQARQKEE